MSGETEQRTKVLRVATRCASIEQFVEAFARYCQKRTLYIASMTTRSPGSQSPFVILLADGAQAMRGTCEVVEAWATPSGPFRRPGVRVKFLQLDAASEGVLTRLHAFAPPPPVIPRPPVLPPLPKPAAPPTPAATGTTRMPALPPMPPPQVPPPRPALPPLGPRRPTMAVAAVPAPAPPPLVALTPPPVAAPSVATIPPLLDDGWAAPSAPPPDDEPKTDVDASPDALRAIREATAAKAAAPESPFEALDLDAERPGPEAAHAEEPRTTHDTDPPPMEERAPGSPYILPANPLTGITDENLRGFIECTLYEETGKFSFDDLLERTGEDSDDAPIVEPPLPPELVPIPRRDQTPIPARRDATPVPARRDQTPVPTPIAASAEAPAASVEPAPVAVVENLPTQTPPALPPEPSPPPVTVSTPTPPWPQAEPPAWPRAATPLPPTAAAYPPAPPSHAAAPAFHLPVDVDPPEPRRPAYGPMIIGLVAAACVGGAAVYLAMRGSSTSAPAAAASTTSDAAVRSAPVAEATPSDAARVADTARVGDRPPARAGDPDPDPVPDSVAEPDPDSVADPVAEPAPPADQGAVAEPPPLPPARAIAAGECAVELRTTPPGAAVRHNGAKLGETPLTASLPCGRARLVLTRSRYADVERSVELAAGTVETLAITLERPEHRVKIVSTPGGATVSINGKRVGTTPTTIKVPGFQTLDVEMRRAGFRTLRTRHYSKRDGSVFAARLEKGS